MFEAARNKLLAIGIDIDFTSIDHEDEVYDLLALYIDRNEADTWMCEVVSS